MKYPSRSVVFGCLLAMISSFSATSAKAQVTPYINLEVVASYWDFDFLEDDASLGLAAALGLRLNKLASVELGYQNFGTTNFRSATTEGELEIESLSGAVLLHFPLLKKYQGFVLLGFENVEFTEQSTAATFDFGDESNDEGFFGVGFLLQRSERSAYRVSLLSHAEGDVIRLSIGGNLDLLDL